MTENSTSMPSQRRDSASSETGTLTGSQGPVDSAVPSSGSQLLNAMSIDVEEHFQVSAFEERIPRADWPSHASRVERNIGRILALLDETDSRATFFTLGCVAERHPEMIRELVACGHEVASHGWNHTRVRNQTSDEFRADVERTKSLLEDISGKSVNGYRAASFSIGADTPWAHDVLLETGHVYSSSVYPIHHDHYGSPDSPRFANRARSGGLLEIPLTTVRAFGRNIPGAGGGYFRLLPFAYSRWAIRRVNQRDGMPAVFYMHPWEVDPDQPRVSGISMKTKFRHYVNLSRFEARLGKLLGGFRWGRMDDVYRDAIQGH
ncbi:MAG: DUF3473 domain-containing protein [Woeseiaceae bacterium]|nr:DUF3473 domain-containing protein [Woeseiaceae bacterium]